MIVKRKSSQDGDSRCDAIVKNARKADAVVTAPWREPCWSTWTRKGDHEKHRVGPRGPTSTFRATGLLVHVDQRGGRRRKMPPGPRGPTSEIPKIQGSGVPSGVPCGEGRIEDEAAGRIEGRAALVTPRNSCPGPATLHLACTPTNGVPSARPLSPNHWGEGSGSCHPRRFNKGGWRGRGKGGCSQEFGNSLVQGQVGLRADGVTFLSPRSSSFRARQEGGSTSTRARGPGTDRIHG